MKGVQQVDSLGCVPETPFHPHSRTTPVHGSLDTDVDDSTLLAAPPGGRELSPGATEQCREVPLAGGSSRGLLGSRQQSGVTDMSLIQVASLLTFVFSCAACRCIKYFFHPYTSWHCLHLLLERFTR
jgi:hypothetical protein